MFYLVWCNFHLKSMFWGENMILFLYYHLLCSFMSAYVISHISETAISTKSLPCLSNKFSTTFSVSNHVLSISIRKSPERAFQQYIILSKLTPGLKFMPKWKKVPYNLTLPLFPFSSYTLFHKKFEVFLYKTPYPLPDGIISFIKFFWLIKIPDAIKISPLIYPSRL